jgi:hypothetical protein
MRFDISEIKKLSVEKRRCGRESPEIIALLEERIAKIERR